MESVEAAKARGETQARAPSPASPRDANVVAANVWTRSGEGRRALFVATVAATVQGFLIPYARRLRQQGWRVDCLAAGAGASELLREEFDACWEAPWTRNPLGREGLRRAPRLVRDIVASQGYHVVHVHTPVAAFLTRWALRRRAPGKPCVIYTAHGFHFHSGGRWLRNLVFRLIERLAARWTDFLVTINEEDRDAAVAHRFLPEERIVRTPGIGVDVAAYADAVPAGARESVRRELELPPGARIVTMVAEFTANKRQRDLVEALAILRCRDVHVLFAGTGPEEYPVEILAFKRGVFDRVHFLGVRDDVPRLLGASDLFVLTSAREGMPRAVMEALCVGVPVVGTNVRGTRDLLATGAGALVPVGDVEALAERIRELLGDPARRAAMGRRGRALIEEYDLSRTLEIHDALYDRAMQAFTGRERAILGATVPAEGRAG
ncbi:MAG TPA: glycosyltransferase family 4 protein [Vulgatibacter sp.]|nr:glycosyltransferase family 4 protein [Vulgatibacter sp.]